MKNLPQLEEYYRTMNQSSRERLMRLAKDYAESFPDPNIVGVSQKPHTAKHLRLVSPTGGAR